MAIMSPGTIVVASSDLARYPGFTVSLLHLQRPPGTEWRFQVGLNVAASLNQGIQTMVGEWVWIMGDDHILPPDTLMRLLAHNKDVIVPVCVRRKPPFIPVIFKKPEEGTPEWRFPPWKWTELPKEGGVHKIWVAGSAGMLIRRRVLEDMPFPWFEVGQQDSQQLNEDSYFCTKLQRMGVDIHVDLDTWIGHVTPCVLWPARTKDGSWTVEVRFDGQMKMQLPPGAAEKGWDNYPG
jgi:hypothetical protein